MTLNKEVGDDAGAPDEDDAESDEGDCLRVHRGLLGRSGVRSSPHQMRGPMIDRVAFGKIVLAFDSFRRWMMNGVVLYIVKKVGN